MLPEAVVYQKTPCRMILCPCASVPTSSHATGGDRRERSVRPRLVVQRADQASPCCSEVSRPEGGSCVRRFRLSVESQLGRYSKTLYCPVRGAVVAFAEESRAGQHRSVSSRVSHGYLVDPASSHMLVSKTKPCMSKYERFVL